MCLCHTAVRVTKLPGTCFYFFFEQKVTAMKSPAIKNLKKKTVTVFSYNQLSTVNPSDTNTGDPTNTTITILTTVSGPALSLNQQNPVKRRL
jgi:hypothetical protein